MWARAWEERNKDGGWVGGALALRFGGGACRAADIRPFDRLRDRASTGGWWLL
ncbi:MAG: hypothetical protein LBS86_04395 [Treponema sp.]|nr:hypothetical protein [Treponema sp.]